MIAGLVLVYLGAIVAANLVIATWGPSAAVAVAFLLVGLDLSTRDRLHSVYAGRARILFLGAIIGAGGLLSYLLNRDAGIVALASTVAFVAAAIVDSIAYELLEGRSEAVRVNGSNVAAAIVDSVLFLGIAFGAFLSPLVAAQITAKIAGGFVWSLLLPSPRRYLEPEAWELEYQTGIDPEVDL